MRKCIIFFFISIISIANYANEPLSFIFKSPYSLEETVTRLQSAIQSANYRTYEPKNLLAHLTFDEDTSKQVVLRFCNFAKMYEFMQIEKRLGVVLPCRITAFENSQNKVFVVIENYARTVQKFNNTQITKEAKDINQELQEVIQEALW
jgi:uncharacterized protein (DUF302 family)